jgi:hypothetical protein
MIPLFGAAIASAAPCPDEPIAPDPIAVSFQDGGLGAPRRACGRSEAGVSLGGAAIIDLPAFYGDVVASLRADGSVRATPRTELWGRIELVRIEAVIGALSSEVWGTGFTTLGATHGLWADDQVALAWTGAVVLPTAVGLYHHALPFSAESGLTADWRQGPWRAGGQVSVLGATAWSAAPANPQLGFAPSLRLGWQPTQALQGLIELRSGFGLEAPVDHVAVGGVVRLAPHPDWIVELGTLIPTHGRERSLANGQLRIARRF